MRPLVKTATAAMATLGGYDHNDGDCDGDYAVGYGYGAVRPDENYDTEFIYDSSSGPSDCDLSRIPDEELDRSDSD